MPQLTSSVPRYRKHRASGQAIVTLSGRDFYLGPHGTQVSRREYDRLIAEWLARGRTLIAPASSQDLTVVELLAAYRRHAKSYYVKNGQPTNEVKMILAAMKFVRQLYETELVTAFGPLKLQALQQAMIRANLSRGLINKQISRITRMFRWGVAHELVPPHVLHALQEVAGLAQGRSAARETDPIVPVAEDVLEATLLHLSPVLADMVRLQRWTGTRPEEVCYLRPADLDCSGKVWTYRPVGHKTEHQGRERIIFIGPKGQAVLKKYLARRPEQFCFSPVEAEHSRRVQLHQARKTPLSCGNRPGSNRKIGPARRPHDRYTTASYRRAIHRACERAGTQKWSPHRLRHSAATDIRKQFGLEAAQVTLGHATANVTQVYAERDMALAARVMLEAG